MMETSDASVMSGPAPAAPAPAAEDPAPAKKARAGLGRSAKAPAAPKPPRSASSTAPTGAAKTSSTLKAAKTPGFSKEAKAVKAVKVVKTAKPATSAAPRRAMTTTMAMASSVLAGRGRGAAAAVAAPACLYQGFFGLQREPFSIAPDPRAMFMSERHREALAHLMYGVESGSGGFVLLTGEIGAGKTTVSRCLLEQMPAQVRLAWILNPRQNADELLATICEEFGIKVREPDAAPGAEAGARESLGERAVVSAVSVPAQGISAPAAADMPASSATAAVDRAATAGGNRVAEPEFSLHAIDPPTGPVWPDRVEPPLRRSTKHYVDALSRFLLDHHLRGRRCVLIIDEAQSLGADVLEQLRLLTNLETHDRKLLQVVLIGQPELRTLLAGPGMEQFSQRVIARYHLGPLSEGETVKYIRHRMESAGLVGVLPFDAAALTRAHRLTRGVPRRINLLCDRALLGAYAQRLGSIDVAVLQKAWIEVVGADDPMSSGTSVRGILDALLPEAWRGSARTVAWAAVVGVVMLAGLIWWFARGGAGPDAMRPTPATPAVAEPAAAGERLPR